jgi:hypothetical protein
MEKRGAGLGIGSLLPLGTLFCRLSRGEIGQIEIEAAVVVPEICAIAIAGLSSLNGVSYA